MTGKKGGKKRFWSNDERGEENTTIFLPVEIEGVAPSPTSPHLAASPPALERGNKELRQANGILRKASAYFAQVEPDRRFGK